MNSALTLDCLLAKELITQEQYNSWIGIVSRLPENSSQLLQLLTSSTLASGGGGGDIAALQAQVDALELVVNGPPDGLVSDLNTLQTQVNSVASEVADHIGVGGTAQHPPVTTEDAGFMTPALLNLVNGDQPGQANTKPVYYVATWGNIATAKVGNPLRPYPNNEAISLPGSWTEADIVFLNDCKGAVLDLYIPAQFAGVDHRLNIRGPGTIVIYAPEFTDVDLSIFSDNMSIMGIFFAVVPFNPESPNTGTLYASGCNFKEGINAGGNVKLDNCLVSIACNLTISGGGGGYGSGGGATIAYNIFAELSRFVEVTINGYDLTFITCNLNASPTVAPGGLTTTNSAIF